MRNVYRYHRNEIFAAVRNEYTDWEKPIQHPINIRDATLESLSDAAGAAPALRVVQLHARRGARTYFAHFAHQNKDADYPQVLTTHVQSANARPPVALISNLNSTPSKAAEYIHVLITVVISRGELVNNPLHIL